MPPPDSDSEDSGWAPPLRVCDSVGLGWSPRICISSRFSDKAMAAAAAGLLIRL